MKRSLATIASLAAVTACSGVARAAQESLVDLLPAKARMAVVVRKGATAGVRDVLFKDVEMMRELGPYLERSLGLDPTRVEGAIAFTFGAGEGDPKAAVILRIPGAPAGGLKLAKAGDAFGTPLYRLDRDVVCARIKAGLVAGHEAEVRAAVGVDRGREPRLALDAGLGKLLDTEHDDIDVALAFGPGAIAPLAGMGVDDLLLVYRRAGTVEGRLRGDPTKLAALRQMALGGMQMALAQLDQERLKQTATNDPAKGASAILLYYQAKRAFAELEPKLEGNALVVRYKLPDLQGLGASTGMLAVGVLAGVAIPAYQKYVKRAKATEASIQLGRLAEAIRMAKLIDRKGKGNLKATDWTPRTGCCGQKGDRCAPDAKAWQAAPWSTLGFTIDEPHYFQYRVQVDASSTPPRYTVEARADLDCDGKFSSYRRAVTGDAQPGPLEVENETE